MLDKNRDRLNVIVILTDDQGYWALGCEGNKEIKTPNLDKLAASGIHFKNFFCVSPVCSPARASLLTGRIPSQHGVHDWIRAGNSVAEPENKSKLIQYLKGQTAYTDILAKHGYICGISGKWHLGDCHYPQKSFTYWKVYARGAGDYYYAPMVKDEKSIHFKSQYITDLITDNALKFLEHQKDTSKPFYLSVHYTAPHSPWERFQHPPEYYDDYYNNCAFQSVPDEPAHSDMRANADFFKSPEKRREKLSGYYAAVTAMDANVGRIINWLDNNNLRENTLIFFTSDNGMNMGHHGICGKGNGTYPMNMFDTSVKVPAIISHPGSIPAGIECKELFSHYDFMPTLLDYLNLANPEANKLPGRSFVELLKTGKTAGRENVIVYDEYGPVRMIRNKEWKYVHVYINDTYQLYDLRNDMEEKNNLYSKLEYKEIVDDMRRQMDNWFNKYTITEMDGKVKPVTGMGQLDLTTVKQKGDIPFAQKEMKSWHKKEDFDYLNKVFYKGRR